MIYFSHLKIDDTIFIIEDAPIKIIEMNVIEIGYDEKYNRRIKLINSEMSFEIEFDNIKERMFLDKGLAYAVATKNILDETNKYIREISADRFEDYIDLNDSLEHYKKIYPQIFI